MFALADPSGLALVDSEFSARTYVAIGITISASWSPAGDAVAFYATDEYSQGPLCVLGNGETLRELAPCASAGWAGPSIAWSPDATRIAFTELPSPCLDTSEQRLAIVDVRDGTITPLGSDLAFPVWLGAP